MKLDKAINSWRSSRDIQKLLLISLVASTIANIILVFSLAFKDTIITMVPPTLNADAQIGGSYASQSYVEAWSLFASQSLGNVTPNSVGFIKTVLEPILSPRVYQDVFKALERQADDIRNNNISLHFEPRQVIHEKETDLVFVYGMSVLESPSGQRKRKAKTYEFRFDVINFMPSLVHVATYEGEPKTLEAQAIEKERAERKGEA